MGFLDRLFGRGDHASASNAPTVQTRTQIVDFDAQGSVRISDTTTFKKSVANRVGLKVTGPPEGYALVPGSLQNEYFGEEPSRTTSLFVERIVIGSLPKYLADMLNLRDGARLQVPVQIFTSATPKGPRVDAWAWIGSSTPQWEYSA